MPSGRFGGREGWKAARGPQEAAEQHENRKDEPMDDKTREQLRKVFGDPKPPEQRNQGEPVTLEDLHRMSANYATLIAGPDDVVVPDDDGPAAISPNGELSRDFRAGVAITTDDLDRLGITEDYVREHLPGVMVMPPPRREGA